MIVITTAITLSLKASSRLRLMVDRSSRSGEGGAQHARRQRLGRLLSLLLGLCAREQEGGGKTGGDQPDREPERRAERVGDQWRRVRLPRPRQPCDDVATSQEAPRLVAAVVLEMGWPSLLLFRCSASRGFIGPPSKLPRRLGRRPLRAAPQAGVRC